ncbi:hypothetical protein C2S52_003704 [Perilla frutescens var. hirtella]|nr:hypothetical protein C2S52_003704 [Perilla frutescens var. hirtella]
MEGRIEKLEKRSEDLCATIEQWQPHIDKLSQIDDLTAKLDSLAAMVAVMAKEKGMATEEGHAEDSTSHSVAAKEQTTLHNEGFVAKTPPLAGGHTTGERPTTMSVSQDAYVAASRLTLPTFDGSHPESWIARAEQFFRLQGVLEAHKVDVVLVAMEGTALNWFQLTQNRFPNITWAQLKLELLRQYGDDPMANTFEALLYTRQTGTMSEYVDLFISRLAHVPGLADIYCLGMFLHGLRDEIRLRIRAREAKDLFETFH